MDSNSWKALMPDDRHQESYRLENLFALSELQEMQDAFAAALGVASIITDIDGKPITRPSNYCTFCTRVVASTEKGRRLCAHSHSMECSPDRGAPSFKYCLSAGFMDGGAGIFVGDIHVANWLIGQVMDSEDSDARMMAFCRDIGADEAEFTAALAQVTRMSRKRYEEISHMLFVFARQLSALAIQNALQSDIISQKQEQEKKTLYLLHHDPLTTLYNRRYFDQALQQQMDSYEPPLSIIMGDVNGLKMINDVFGHDQGDRHLMRIATLFRQIFPEHFTLARVGGDEFAILLPDTPLSEAEEYMNGLKALCSLQTSALIHISVAMGAATATAAGQNLEKVMKQAEDRMYNNKLLENRSTRSSIINSLRQTLEEKTHETEAHCQRLKLSMLSLSKALQLPESQNAEIELLAILHDIGKVAIPNQILDKPGSLTPEEWEVMRSHSEIGFRIASRTPELIAIAEPILYHHERWDGKGYPLGLSGESIPITARILAVVDAYDAMTHDRVYHSGIPAEEALSEIRRCAGTQFDPLVADIFVRLAGCETLMN